MRVILNLKNIVCKYESIYFYFIHIYNIYYYVLYNLNILLIFLLLLLTRAYIPKDVQAIIEGSDFASNIYEYFPTSNSNLYPSFLRRFDFELTNQSLDPLNIKYDSTFANINSILAWSIFMIVFSVLVWFLRVFLSRIGETQRCSCLLKFLNWIVDKLYRMMIFGYFIRNALEMSQFILISAINEIYENNTSNSDRLISFLFSILVIIIFVLMVILVLYLTFSSYKLYENKHNKLEEFFRGLQQSKKHKFYTTLLLLRRLWFIILLITWIWIPSRILCIILAIIQILYIAILFYLRPYDCMRGNLIEIFNEIYFEFLILFLAIINTEDEWSFAKTNAYMWVLASNTFVVLIIVLGKRIFALFRIYDKRDNTINKEKMMKIWCNYLIYKIYRKTEMKLSKSLQNSYKVYVLTYHL